MMSQRNDPRPLPEALVVDDSDDDAMILRMALRRSGVFGAVDRARDGDAALAALEARSLRPSPPPLLLFLDLHMPGRDGWEVLDQIANRPADRRRGLAVVVLLSSLQLEDERVRAESYPFVLGARAKPLSIADLAVLAAAID